jgi:ankyrin repeat protein
MQSVKLIQQCISGDIAAVRDLVAEMADVNAVLRGNSPLLAAIETNNIDLLDVLLQAGVDIPRFSHQSRTALVVAALQGRLVVVRWLLQQHPASLLDVRDDLGCTALILAVQNGNLDVASELLSVGADATIASNDGTTALTACSDVGMAERLLDLGLDIHARCEGGMDALLLACKRGDAEMATMLLSRGAGVYTRDHTGATALMHACDGGHAEVVKLLLEQKPHEDAENRWDEWTHAPRNDGITALHLAAHGGCVGCVQALVDAGVDVNVLIANVLGVNVMGVNHLGGDGSTPLHCAENVEVARILLDAGAEDLANNIDVTAASLACGIPDRIEILRLLLERFPDCGSPIRPLLFYAVENSNLEAVRALVAARPPGYVNIRDTLDLTALHMAMDPETARLLLELGADPRAVDKRGHTVLMGLGNVDFARLLLETAPDSVNARDLKGRTALMHLSCSPTDHKVLQELLRFIEERGIDAEVNHRDVNGDTALHMAMMGGNHLSVPLLLEKGAKVLGSGYEEMTVLMKLFMSDEAIESTYPHICWHISNIPEVNPWDNPDVDECLRIVLRTVFRHGDGVWKPDTPQIDADEDVGDAELEVPSDYELYQSFVKRRRLD